MKVIHFIASKGWGGAEKSFVEFARNLVSEFFFCFFITFDFAIFFEATMCHCSADWAVFFLSLSKSKFLTLSCFLLFLFAAAFLCCSTVRFSDTRCGWESESGNEWIWLFCNNCHWVNRYRIRFRNTGCRYIASLNRNHSYRCTISIWIY